MASVDDQQLDCDSCNLGPCPDCGQCCALCLCPQLEPDDQELSDMEDERYFWERPNLM